MIITERKTQGSKRQAKSPHLTSRVMRPIPGIEDGIVLPTTVKRSRTRGDCRQECRPCPWVGCRYHLYLDILPSGSIRVNFPDLKPWELREACALDVADRGGISLEVLGRLMNLTRECIRLIERGALKKLEERLTKKPW